MSIEDLVAEIKAGNTGAKNDLWECVRKWVAVLCRRYMHGAEALHMELQDLVNISWFGVDKAVKAYRPEKGYAFLTCMSFYVRKELRNALGLRDGHGYKIPLSLDEPIQNEDNDDLTRLDLIEDKHAAEPFEAVEDRELADWLWSCVDRLDDKHAAVIRSHYRDMRSLGSVAAELGVSQSRAQQLKNEALRAMRKDKQIRAYRSEFAYAHRGVKTFNTTWTSSTEWAVLKLDELMEQIRRERRRTQ